eukprot:CAMPEP_0195283806 /NCGR_PEP_ID=MMETSP0707-20130614/2229_1 /TAXON_ID=33640 /ORGANISM="Asterionellopsis glacialis, Strain CCMP134" /LENGTH=299 /DNA_ID=CAMNT_0040343041 /DNA_START=492 /DNA_END=1391 /DNA_ORIENTATION=+
MCIAGKDPPKTIQNFERVLEATLVPSLLISFFEITYLVHKTRSVQFCGIYEGHSRSKNPVRTFLLKSCIRIVAIILLALGLMVNFSLAVTKESNKAGLAGWWTLLNTIKEDNWDIHLFLALIPPAILGLCSSYFSTALWRYGTEHSMVVHSSFWNPWFSPFFGTIALLGGQMFGPRWYALLSNLGFYVFIEFILLLLPEVERDWDEANELQNFLGALSGGKDPPSRPLEADILKMEEACTASFDMEEDATRGKLMKEDSIQTLDDSVLGPAKVNDVAPLSEIEDAPEVNSFSLGSTFKI